MNKRIAVVLFNLGGPDREESIRPFLFNLFNDRAIIRLPAILRIPLAYLIAARRSKGAAKDSYSKLGGRSPLLPNTLAQAEALEAALRNALPRETEAKAFIAMRYWHPMADEVALQVKEFAPDRIILLPLYPQFSTTTTASSWRMWQLAAQRAAIAAPTDLVCCYPTQKGFIESLARAVRAAWDKAAQHGRPRILLSAHGLPESIVRAGDPYQAQCEATANALCREIGLPDLDAVLCYQSRVGPLRWIGPATEAEIARAGAEKRPLIVVPIAFVSDHVETLVELDIEYRHKAEAAGVPSYETVRAVGTAPAFIGGLAQLVLERLLDPRACAPEGGARICAKDAKGCPCLLLSNAGADDRREAA